jgi:hypothetical protein
LDPGLSWKGERRETESMEKSLKGIFGSSLFISIELARPVGIGNKRAYIHHF